MWYKKPSKEELNAQLIEAAEAGNIKNVKKLLKQGAEVDARDNYGWTALMRAAMWGHLDVVKFLAELGADLSAKNNEGKTVMMIARENSRKGVADYLDPLTQFKERIENTGKGNDGSGLELKPDIRGMLRTEKGHEYNVARHGVSYAV